MKGAVAVTLPNFAWMAVEGFQAVFRRLSGVFASFQRCFRRPHGVGWRRRSRFPEFSRLYGRSRRTRYARFFRGSEPFCIVSFNETTIWRFYFIYLNYYCGLQSIKMVSLINFYIRSSIILQLNYRYCFVLKFETSDFFYFKWKYIFINVC